ncbi:MAG: alpha/beta hydrolase [Oculatellaceae cyanobacterium Prado106]|jgi:pimeloyl-ACP methyl ester carboxylesterase|nr:alpha/beta hydrolase [Oculatellaceae cyanobacterium Prado106]
MFSANLSNPVEIRTRHKVTGAQGVTLSVQEWGNPNGTVMLFAHAYGTSHLAWLPQVTSELAHEFRMITFDHRGHGESDKPLTPDGYNSRDVFADDIQAIATQLNLKKFILVGWSMSGALVGDYLTKYGDSNIIGLVLVAAANKLGPSFFASQVGAALAHPTSQGIFSEDLFTQIGAWNFLNSHLATDPFNQDTKDIILANSMLMPLVARGTIIMRDEDYLPLYQNLNAPILMVHAADDQIVLPAAAEQLKAVRPDAQYISYPRGAHAPHWDNPENFNAELAKFARQAVQNAVSGVA